MRKIELSSKMIEYHQEYFKNSIRPNFFGTINSIKFCSIFDEHKHRRFMNFCYHNYKELAIGNVNKIEEMYRLIKKNHSRILTMIEKGIKCKYLEDEIAYKDLLIEIFGYYKFNTSSLFDYIKKQVIKDTGQSQYNLKVQYSIADLLLNVYPNKKNIINRYKNKYIPVTKFAAEFEKLICTDITLENFKKYDLFRKEWSPYTYVFMSGLRVCPYCNRQYITPVYSQNGSVRADLDHFLPKYKYPFFSMSLYNLIPSCKFCNSSLKGTNEYDFNVLNPFKDNIDDYIKFQVDITNNIGDIHVKSIRKNDKKTENYKQLFKVETLYNYHKNQARTLIQKRLTYSEEQINDLYQNNKKYYHNINEVKELIIGYPISKDKINDEPLAKFKRDIVEQLRFNDDNAKDLIDQLKAIFKKSKLKNDI